MRNCFAGEHLTVGSLLEDMQAFSTKFQQPQVRVPGRVPEALNEHIDFRILLMQEELTETLEAFDNRDMTEVLDGLVDLVYVVLGTAHFLNLPFQEAWDEIHHSNMQKELTTEDTIGSAKRGYILDVIKPEGWRPPDIKRIMQEARDDYPTG
jgi:hypothetical protein